MNIKQLITHPELMDKETLYDLRSLLAQYPYSQVATATKPLPASRCHF